MNNTKKMTETALITALAVVFMFIGLNILPIIFIIFPVPFIILGTRQGIRYAFLSVITSTLLVGMLINIIDGLIIFAFSAVIAIPIVYMLNKKSDTSKIIITSSVISLISVAIMLFIFGKITGTNLIDIVETYVNESLNVYKDIIGSLGVSTFEKSQITDILEFTSSQIILLIPSSVIMSAILYSIINYQVSIIILNKLGYKYKGVPRFKDFRLPSNIISGSAVIMIGILIIKYLDVFYYENIAINVIAILFFLFYIQGLAVVVFWLNKTKMNGFFRKLIVFIIFITVSFSFVVAIIGGTDALFNYRKLNKYEV